jgi:hypothetical protein
MTDAKLKSLVERLSALYERQIELAARIDADTGELAKMLALPQVRTYVIRGEGTNLVKIGKSHQVDRRVRNLQASSPAKLKILRSIPFDCERRMHMRFSHLRRHGEWFTFDIDMLAETFHEDILGLASAKLEAA